MRHRDLVEYVHETRRRHGEKTPGSKAEPWPALGPDAIVITSGVDTVDEAGKPKPGYLGTKTHYKFRKGHYLIELYSGFGSSCTASEVAELSTLVAKRVEKLP